MVSNMHRLSVFASLQKRIWKVYLLLVIRHENMSKNEELFMVMVVYMLVGLRVPSTIPL